MSRPSDWSPLHYTDPVPGEPETVSRSAQHYHETADAIRTAADRLRRITEGTTEARGKYIEKFREQAEGVAAKVDDAYQRYEQTADALAKYAPHFQQAQDDSMTALTRARTAQDEIDRLRTQIPEWDGPPPGAPGTAPGEIDQQAWDDYQARRNQVEAKIQAAEDEIARQEAAMWAAAEDNDKAAQEAQNSIENIITNDGLEDSAWTNFLQGLKAIASWASKIATWVGMAALVLAWVPILGQALAAIALLAGAVALVCNITLAASGRPRWDEVLVGAIGLLTFGIGRAAKPIARLGGRLVKSSAKMRGVMQGTARVLRNSRLAGRSRVTRVSSYLDDVATRAEGATFRRAWPGVKSDMGDVVREAGGAYRRVLDDVWAPVKNPSRMWQLADDDALKMVGDDTWGAVKKAYPDLDQDSIGATLVGGSNFVVSQSMTMDSAWAGVTGEKSHWAHD